MIKYKDKLFNNGKEIRAVIGRDAYKQALASGEIILNYSEPTMSQDEEIPTILYYFKNKVNGHTITSIESDLKHLDNYINLDEWYQVDKI